MSKVCTLSMEVKVNKWHKLLYPLWVIQVLFGFKPYMPKWAIDYKIVSNKVEK